MATTPRLGRRPDSFTCRCRLNATIVPHLRSSLAEKLVQAPPVNPRKIRRKLSGKSKITKADELAIRQAISLVKSDIM
jgi:hypothetical protein